MKYLKLAFAGSMLCACAILMAGCGNGGSGSSTNGTLTLSSATATDKTGGTYNVSATAAYAPPAGKVTNGAQISFSWLATPAGSTTSIPGAATTTLGSDGIGTVSFDVNQTTVPIYITVKAGIGDLSQNTQVSIPAATSFSATPAVITFDATAAAGISQTITLAGTYAPYRASSISTDINVSVSGSTVTVTKISATGTVQKNASITLTDNGRSAIQVPVTYY